MIIRLKRAGTNKTELYLNCNLIFFSYDTPVAACVDSKYYRTSKFWSSTTSRHINQWLNSYRAVASEKEQSFFYNLITINE